MIMFAILLLVILSIIIPVVYPTRKSRYIGLALINGSILYAFLMKTSLHTADVLSISAWMLLTVFCTTMVYQIFFKTVSRL